MKITKDGFVWLTVNADKATEIWQKKCSTCLYSMMMIPKD